MRLLDLNTKPWAIPPQADQVSHHARHVMSRRAFIGSIGATGAAAGVGLLSRGALAAKPSNPAPQPTPTAMTINGVTFHFTSFGPGLDPSSINDFNGFVGVAIDHFLSIATSIAVTATSKTLRHRVEATTDEMCSESPNCLSTKAWETIYESSYEGM